MNKVVSSLVAATGIAFFSQAALACTPGQLFCYTPIVVKCKDPDGNTIQPGPGQTCMEEPARFLSPDPAGQMKLWKWTCLLNGVPCGWD